MRDPFLTPRKSIVRSAEPLAYTLGLRTLPFHAHEIILAFTVYNVVNSIISPAISARLFPRSYPRLQRKAKVNWNSHVVSMVQSCFINMVALWVMLKDKERSQMDAVERVWGYTGASGMVQGFAAGYFLWDLGACIKDVDVQGLVSLMHAASALAVTCLGFVYLIFRKIEFPSNC